MRLPRLSTIYSGKIHEIIKKSAENAIIIDGHYAVSVVPKESVTKVFVLRRYPVELRSFMENCGFSGDKLWENLASEILDVCLVDALNVHDKGKVCELDTTSKTVEEVAQAVDVPLVIGGCGDPVKDADVFAEITETFAGERFLISSLTRDMDVERCAKFVKKNGHVALSFTPMDLNLARELNRRLYDFLGKEDIVMDLTTAALGYGLDYAFTNMERARLAGLMGDVELAHPMSSGTTNAWAAREAWLKMGPEWEPRELRGPLWEVITALTSTNLQTAPGSGVI
jgi:CO dehydrogenase/acetyl-CoA synthase delta subunit